MSTLRFLQRVGAISLPEDVLALASATSKLNNSTDKLTDDSAEFWLGEERVVEVDDFDSGELDTDRPGFLKGKGLSKREPSRPL